MKSLFIMTIRNKNVDKQRKYTIENGKCMICDYRLHPFSDIMIDKNVVTQKQFIKEINIELGCNIGTESLANVYFNGNNFRKFMNAGRRLR